MDPLLIAILVVGALLLAAVIGAAVWIRGAMAEQLRAQEPALQMLHGSVQAGGQQTAQNVEAMRTTLLQVQQGLAQNLDTSRKSMDERLDNAARVILQVQRQLGELEKSAQSMTDMGRQLSDLQNILRAPKLRGNLGELFLGDLLAQIFPPTQYTLQHTFRDGQRVDAILQLHAGMVPVDAKFPLENFQRVVKAASDDERKAARKAFLRDVKTHVDDIATKYIRPDEGTFDFALMYIPAENVYYETVVKDDEGDGAIFPYALARRVIPVSPNSFYAYLQTILLGLKGLRVEERARDILDAIQRLDAEYERFGESFRLVGQHLENSLKKFQEAEKRFTKVEGRVDDIDGLVRGLEAKTPAALPDVPVR